MSEAAHCGRGRPSVPWACVTARRSSQWAVGVLPIYASGGWVRVAVGLAAHAVCLAGSGRLKR